MNLNHWINQEASCSTTTEEVEEQETEVIQEVISFFITNQTDFLLNPPENLCYDLHTAKYIY